MSDKAHVRLGAMVNAIVRELVDKSDEVVVTAAPSDDGQIVTVTVKTATGEQGKVIGREGRHAQAIRALIEAVGAKHRVRAALEIADSRSPKRRRSNDESNNVGRR